MKRMTTRQVADRLGLTPNVIREYSRLGMLKSITTSGETGLGKRFYFDAAEVEAFASGGAPAAKAYRGKKRSARATS